MKKRAPHSPDLKANVARDAIRDEMPLAELPKTYGVHPVQIGTWKRAAMRTQRRPLPAQVQRPNG